MNKLAFPSLFLSGVLSSLGGVNGQVTITNDLSCSGECVVEQNTVTGTCLYVTLIDQFGDGWEDGTEFTYSMNVAGSGDSNEISMSLTGSCARMSGCIDVTDLGTDHVISMEVSSEGDAPAHSWEVYWTVQLVEQGVWKDKYYGGYDTALSFDYTTSTGAFTSNTLTNPWKPEADVSCDTSSVTDLDSFYESRVWKVGDSARPYSLAGEASSWEVGSGGGYHESVWVITDVETRSDVLGLAVPASCFGSGINQLTNNLCLGTGSFAIRTMGLCDPNRDSMNWAICGGNNMSSLENQLFTIDGSSCTIDDSSVPTTAPSTSAPTIVQEIDYSGVETVLRDIYHANRRSRTRWITMGELNTGVNVCQSPHFYNRFRLMSLAVVFVEGALLATVDLWHRSLKVHRNRATLDLELTAPGGDTFTWSQRLFFESDYVEFLTERPTTVVINPGQTHKLRILLPLDELQDSSGNALSFPPGVDHSLSVTVADYSSSGALNTKDCVLASALQYEAAA